MSGRGGAARTVLDGTGLTVAIVHGTWHATIAGGLLAGARRELQRCGAEIVEYAVPGSFELPVVVDAVLQGTPAAAVALGVIIRGGTPHFDYVCRAATDGLTRVALDRGKPVGFGVLTVDDEQQGLDRAGLPGSSEDKGAEAASAAVTTALLLRRLASTPEAVLSI